MIKYFQCIRKKPGLSTEKFREYLENYQEVLVRAHEAAQAVRFKVSKKLEVEPNIESLLLEDRHTPFDGVVEVWWQSGGDLAAFMEKPEGKYFVSELKALQKEFVDLEHSSFFFAEARQIH